MIAVAVGKGEVIRAAAKLLVVEFTSRAPARGIFRQHLVSRFLVSNYCHGFLIS